MLKTKIFANGVAAKSEGEVEPVKRKRYLKLTQLLITNHYKAVVLLWFSVACFDVSLGAVFILCMY